MELENVELAHFPDVDEIDSSIIGKNIESFFSKVSYLESPQLHLSHKEYAKGGIRKQHEIHAKLLTDTDSIFASDVGWQLLEVLQNTLKKLEKEVLRKHSKK